MRKVEILVLFLILIFGFLVRLYRFDNPVADWHHFRQSDTNAVSAIFARDGINFLYPAYFDISNIQSGKDNPQGYRFVEFPIYNAVQAGLFKAFAVRCQANSPDGCTALTLEQWGRVISIVASLAGALFVYLLTKKYASYLAGFFAAFFYLFLPFSVFYGRIILPDPSMTAAILAGTYFFDKWIENSSNLKVKSAKLQFKVQSFFVLSIIFTALAFLLKPFALFFAIPIVYLAFKKFGVKMAIKPSLWIFAGLALTPLILWRVWISQYLEGIPSSGWLFNGGNIRFTGAFFYWIFAERIAKLILGYFGVFFLILGILRREGEKNYLFFISFLVSSLLYVTIIARGNVQHDYYQILIVPTIAIFAGRGVANLLSIKSFSNGYLKKVIIFIVVLFMFAFSWFYVRDYFNINDKGMVEAGNKANEILPQNATVIAPYDGSTTFLNTIQRRGWPVFQKPIEELIEGGAEYLVIANPTKSDFEGFGKMYESVASSSTYLILRLK